MDPIIKLTGIIPSEHLKKGEPERLINGMDYLGNICGITNYQTGIGKDTINLTRAYFLPSGSSVCIESCPKETNLNKFYCEYELEKVIVEKGAQVELVSGSEAADKIMHNMYLYYTAMKECMPQIKTKDYLGYCKSTVLLEKVSKSLNDELLKTTKETSTNITLTHGQDESSFFDEIMADAYSARYVIFGFGLGAALSLGLVFLILIRMPGVLTTLVWSFIIAICFGLIGAGHYMRETSTQWKAEGLKEEHEIKGLFILSILAHVGAGLWFLTVCFMRKRISLAISCVKEASNAMSAMPIIIISPFFQVVGMCAFLIPFGIYMAYLASSGEVKAECICLLDANEKSQSASLSASLLYNETLQTSGERSCGDHCYLYKTFAYDKKTRYAGIYMVFVWFWTSQFIVSLGELVIAISISMWYFTREKNTIGNSTFFRGFATASTYHLGTCAFGSLIIAIVKTIRSIITYIDRKLSTRKNQFTQVLLKMIHCFLWCVEKCLKFINKNAYIQTAIHGYSFCRASKEAFSLILRNILRISAVSIVSDLVLFVGKMFIVLASTISAYFYMEHYNDADLNGLAMPTILVFIVAYGAADMFNEVFGMAISTILQCFVTDEENFQVMKQYMYISFFIFDLVLT